MRVSISVLDTMLFAMFAVCIIVAVQSSADDVIVAIDRNTAAIETACRAGE